MSKKEVNLKGTVDRDKAAAYLTSLANGLAAGTVRLQNLEDTLSLEPQEYIEFELEAKQRHNKESITIELSWRSQVEQPQQLDLKISAAEPATTASSESGGDED